MNSQTWAALENLRIHWSTAILMIMHEEDVDIDNPEVAALLLCRDALAEALVPLKFDARRKGYGPKVKMAVPVMAEVERMMDDWEGWLYGNRVHDNSELVTRWTQEWKTVKKCFLALEQAIQHPEMITDIVNREDYYGPFNYNKIKSTHRSFLKSDNYQGPPGQPGAV